MQVTADAVTLILSTIDRIKIILDEIKNRTSASRKAVHDDLIDLLGRLANCRAAPSLRPAEKSRLRNSPA